MLEMVPEKLLFAAGEIILVGVNPFGDFRLEVIDCLALFQVAKSFIVSSIIQVVSHSRSDVFIPLNDGGSQVLVRWHNKKLVLGL